MMHSLLISLASGLTPVPTSRLSDSAVGHTIIVLVCILMTLLVTPQLDPAREGGLGYSTWYVAAIGTLAAQPIARQPDGKCLHGEAD